MPTDQENAEAWERYRIEHGIGATLNVYGSQIAKQIKEETKAELRAEYGQAQFWNQFFAANGDLRADEDIVRATMTTNFADLEKMEVTRAIEKLSDLARDAVSADQRRRAAQREYGVFRGGPGMAPNEIAVAPEGVATLSSVLKARQARRSARQAGISSRVADDDY